jgi:hypothetical protein
VNVLASCRHGRVGTTLPLLKNSLLSKKQDDNSRGLKTPVTPLWSIHNYFQHKGMTAMVPLEKLTIKP